MTVYLKITAVEIEIVFVWMLFALWCLFLGGPITYGAVCLLLQERGGGGSSVRAGRRSVRRHGATTATALHGTAQSPR